MTKTATTAETVKTAMAASLSCSLEDKRKEGKVLSRTTETAKPRKPSWRLPPLTQPPLSDILKVQKTAFQSHENNFQNNLRK